MCRVSSENDAKLKPQMVVHGMTTRLGGIRSRRRPIIGAVQATLKTAIVKASDICVRDHPISFATGLRKIPKVEVNSDPKPTITPQQAVRRTKCPPPAVDLFLSEGCTLMRASGVAMDCEPLGGDSMRFSAHRVDSDRVHPMARIEQYTNGDSIIYRSISVSSLKFLVSYGAPGDRASAVSQ